MLENTTPASPPQLQYCTLAKIVELCYEVVLFCIFICVLAIQSPAIVRKGIVSVDVAVVATAEFAASGSGTLKLSSWLKRQ